MHLNLHQTRAVDNGDADAKTVVAALVERAVRNRQRDIERENLLGDQLLTEGGRADGGTGQQNG